MAGPNSAPNGDRSIVADEKIYRLNGELVRKRDMLLHKKQLDSGKTRAKKNKG